MLSKESNRYLGQKRILNKGWMDFAKKEFVLKKKKIELIVKDWKNRYFGQKRI